MEEREAVRDMEEAGGGRRYEGWFVQGRCTLLIKVECWRRQDCRYVEVDPGTHLLGYYWIYCRVVQNDLTHFCV